MLELTSQERDVLAELIYLDVEYEALPPDKRGKFILSTEMRKEIRLSLGMSEKQLNVVISKLKKKTLTNRPLINENNIIHPELKFKPDDNGFSIEINFIMTTVKIPQVIPTTGTQEPTSIPTTVSTPLTPPVEYKHDASKAPVIEEEEFEFTIAPPND